MRRRWVYFNKETETLHRRMEEAAFLWLFSHFTRERSEITNAVNNALVLFRKNTVIYFSHIT